MKALPTIITFDQFDQSEQETNEVFDEVLRNQNPELYLIKMKLEEYKVNPRILPSVIKSIAMVSANGGWGEITLQIRENRVFRIRGTNDEVMNLGLTE